MRASLAISVLSILLLSGCKHRTASSGNPQGVSGSAHNVSGDRAVLAKQQAALLTIATTEMETGVPSAAQRAIPAFKDALVQLADDMLASEPANASDTEVQHALTAALPSGKAPDDTKAIATAKAAGKDEFELPERGDYGGEVKSAVTTLQPGLLLVDTSFGIMCGEDHVLLGYSNATGRWQRVLRWQAKPYAQVSGAFGDMFLPTLLRVKRNGRPVLLVVHGTPWCTSTESNFSMDVFQIHTTGPTEVPFWHGEHSYRRADELFKLKNTKDGFEIRTSVDDRIGDAVSRIGILRYAITGTTTQRTEPIAMNSRESVSEWLDMPREEAKLFTDGPDQSAAWQVWSALTFAGKSTDDAMRIPALSYGEVRACTDPKQYQASIRSEISRDDHTQAPGPSYYVRLTETGEGYRIHDASNRPDNACNGPVIALKPSGGGTEMPDGK